MNIFNAVIPTLSNSNDQLKSNASYSCHQSSTSVSSVPSVANRETSTKRRRYGISTHVNQLYSGNSIVEDGKPHQRRVRRRYAITKYSCLPLNVLHKIIRKEDQETIMNASLLHYADLPGLNDNRVVVFDRYGKLSLIYDGSVNFSSIIAIHYRESYQYCESETHQSIIRATILHELKTRGYRFIRCDGFHNKGLLLDDYEAIQLIHDRFKIEKLRHTERAACA